MEDYRYPPRRQPANRHDNHRYSNYKNERPRRYSSPERRSAKAGSPARDNVPIAATPRDRGRTGNHRDHHSPERYRHRGRTNSVDRSYYRRPDPSRRRHRRHHRERPLPREPRQREDHGSHPPRRRRAVSDARPDYKLQHAAKAAIDAAAVEAIRVRRQPGDWAGQKGVRVATAALGAAATDKAADKLRHGDQEKHSGRHSIESTIGGLLANRVLHGPREDLQRRR